MPTEHERFPPWKRFLTGSLLMILVAAAVAGLTAFSQREDIAKELRRNAIPNVSKWLDARPSGPQTILLLGSDRRSGDADKYGKRSDTMMLVRIDPDLPVTSVLSLPRDLKVEIPGVGTDRLNAAYSLGGTRLTLRTIKKLTGLKINHVVNVDFKGFRQAVDRIGCVYVDVDRRYFNDNTNLYVADQYATINIKAGYQRLCGQNALDYVRYRHEDSDLVRGARQQGFLRQAKQQVGVRELFASGKSLKRIVARSARTDSALAHGRTLQRVLTLAVRSAGKPVWQVRLPVDYATGSVAYVLVSDAAIKRAAREFMRGPKRRGRTQSTSEDAGVPSRRKRSPSRKPAKTAPGLERDPVNGRTQGAAAANGARMPVFYPTVRLGRSVYQLPRSYKIIHPDGGKERAYRIVARTNEIGEYYGVQGTTWLDPPILANPSETRRVNGRKLVLYFEGDRLGLVAWRKGEAVYWVSNTLSRTLTVKQMLGIAASLKRLR